MAPPTGYNDAGGFGEGIPPDLRSRDLPSKRLLGKGLASIGYETEWKGERYARKDFVGVPSNIFLNEAAALVRLKDVHENVVKTHGFTIDKMSCSLVLEYMDDKLSSLLQKRKDQRKRIPTGTVSGNQPEHISTLPFELHEALDFMLQIAKGMEYLHEQGILHGDLKTRNILITYMNNDDKNFSDVKSVKVADFGLVQTKRNSMSHISRQVRKLDTIRWTAPENLKESTSSESDSNSDEEYTGSSGITLRVLLSADVYSFAVTCSQILTGEEPYPRRNWKELEADILSGKLRPKLPPDPLCPKMLSELLVLCWDTDPDKRPTFSDIRKKLEHMHTLRTWIVKEEREQNACLQEQLEKDSSSLKPMELVGPNFPIPTAFDADSSMGSNAPSPHPDLDDHLRKGKALVSEHTEPKESIPSVLGERETFKEIHDQIQAYSRVDDVGPFDQFRDEYDTFLDPVGPASSASSVTIDEQTLEPLWFGKRRRQRSSAAMDDYDVFLNHHVSDVGGGFIAHLYDALRSVGLNPFLDKKCLVKGHNVLNSIYDALEAANIHVAVVSRGYAESKHCLRELVAMTGCGKPVIPIFYDVKPADLRSVEKGVFAAAFEKHKSRESAEQVEEWIAALGNLARINGLCLSTYMGDEAWLKHEVVDAILHFMPPCKDLLCVDYLVGMEEQINTCISKLEKISDATCLLGLVGMGGIGKTSLAKKIYNYFIGQKKFQAMSFLEINCNSPPSIGVDPSLLRRLQRQIMWDLLREPRIQYKYNFLFTKLSRIGPVLIVLDNIHDIRQFDMLIFDTSFLAPGSLIIATSRDQQLLKVVGARMSNFYLHDVTPLNPHDSQKLFNLHAFNNEEAPENFKVIANDVSTGCGGLPLALKVVGSTFDLCSKTSNVDSAWTQSKVIHALKGNHDIMSTLKWLYDCGFYMHMA